MGTEEERVRRALDRSERYVREFVEALGLCPYARLCRESGKLARSVILEAGGPPGTPEYDALLAAALAEVRRLEALPEDAVEVALLIFAEHRAGPVAFDALCAALREAMARGHKGRPPFFCVSFHPDLPQDLSSASRAVGFIRRSPDPTLQLVRSGLLERVRAGRPSGSIFLDASALDLEELGKVEPALGLSEQIAEANLRTLRAHDPNCLADFLRSLRES